MSLFLAVVGYVVAAWLVMRLVDRRRARDAAADREATAAIESWRETP